MSQLWPLQDKKPLRFENSEVPIELVKRIKEEFQKSKDVAALEDTYGKGPVRNALGTKNAEPRDARKDFPPGTKVDMGGGYTGVVTKAESSEAVWVKPDDGGEEVLCKLNKQPIKKLRNALGTTKNAAVQPKARVQVTDPSSFWHGQKGVVQDVSGGGTQVHIKLDSGEEIDVLAKEVKKISNSVKNAKSIDDMSQEIQHRIDAQKNPEKKKKMLEYQKTFKSYAKHRTPADEGYAAATYDDIMGLASNSDPGAGEKKNIKYDYNNPEHKALRDKVAKDMLGKKWSKCSPMEGSRVLEEVEKIIDQNIGEKNSVQNGLTSGEKEHKEILEYVDRNGYVGARSADAVNWLRGNGYLTEGDVSQDKVTSKGKQYLDYLKFLKR
jgi:preprotein translocase subunit YajC